MMKRAVCLVGVFVAIVAFAEPVAIGTKSEIQAARGLIEDLVQSGTGADELLTMAADSTKGAERFWLYWNAFILRAKDGKFAEATEIVKSLRANVTGVPDADIVSLIERNARKGLTESAELAAILKESKIRVAAQKLVTQLKKDVQKNPKDDGLKVSLAEALAVSGDWDAALKAFSETKNDAAAIAKSELAKKASAKIAAFWWDYKPCSALSSSTAFKAHAVGIYAVLLERDGLSMIERTLAEKRVAQFSGPLIGGVCDKHEEEVVEDKAKGEDLYCVIDLRKNRNNKRVSFLPEPPRGGWTKMYKTDYLVLRRISGAENEKSTYIGIFECTQGQWKQVMAKDPSVNKGKPTFPAENMSWHEGQEFVRKLNETLGLSKQGIVFKLPSDGEWMFTANQPSPPIEECAWVKENSGEVSHEVGMKQPNCLGVYDIKGNVWEWNNDCPGGKGRRRGKCFGDSKDDMSMNHWVNTPAHRHYWVLGFRLAIDRTPTVNRAD